MANSILIGSDPELVIRRRKNRDPISAPDVLPASITKETPFVCEVGQIFPDNANLEVNLPPAATEDEFVANVRAILKEAKTLIGKDYYLAAPSSLHYPSTTLLHETCKKFGCEPDYDAWTLSVNEVAAGAASETLRTCGGHIHIGHRQGYDFLMDDFGKVDAIKAMDTVLGVSAVFLDNDPASIVRRNLYGSPGAHRPKSYGVEHRTLSNFWVRDPQLVRWAWSMTNIAMRMVEEKVLSRIIDKHDVPAAIKTGDKKKAAEIYDAVADSYPEVTQIHYKCLGLTSDRTKFRSLEQTWNL